MKRYCKVTDHLYSHHSPCNDSQTILATSRSDAKDRYRILSPTVVLHRLTASIIYYRPDDYPPPGDA